MFRTYDAWKAHNPEDDYWDEFEPEEEEGEVCQRCDILIRPEGGHRCGSCGRDI